MAIIKEIGKAYSGILRWVGLLAALNLIQLLLLLSVKDPKASVWIAQIGRIAIPAIAGLLCFGLSKAPTFRRLSVSKHLPAVLGYALLALSLGNTIELIEVRLLNRQSPYGYSDLIYLAQYVLVIVGIILWPSKPLPGALRWRTWSDAIVLLLALMAFGWVSVIGPAMLESDVSSLGIIVDMSYPVGDILIIFSVLQMMRKGFDPRFRLATHLFVLAMACNTVADLYFAAARIEGVSIAGGWLEVTWPFTASLIACAAMAVKTKMQAPGYEDAQNDERIVVSQRTWTLYAPYVLVPAVGALIFHSARSGVADLIRNGLYICGLGLVVAILVRQLIVIAENGSLYSRLIEAYDELEEKNIQLLVATDETANINDRLRSMTDELKGQNQTLSASNEALERMATRDGMTGLANHRSFQERLKEELSKASRNSHGLILALIDVDFFKQYNDHYGHPAGDDVLKSIANLLQECTRKGDLAARYGGEEFALLLPHTDLENACSILERLREAVSTFPFQHRRVTLSIGVSALSDECASPERMVELADKSLYLAKNRGRNQVVTTSCAASADQRPKSNGFDTSTPVGYAKMLLAGLQYHPQALALEPQCALIGGLLATLELKDPMTRGQSQRTMQFALRLAEEVIKRGEAQFNATELKALAFGALLHDVGRLGVSERVLTSIEPFSPEERKEIERHPDIGADLVQRFPALACSIPLIRHHHERWDGNGYPDRLAQENIPLAARILAYADALNAMSTDRPYAAKRNYQEIRAEFERHSGGQFDPGLLAAFLAVPVEEWEHLRVSAQVELDITSKAA